MKALRPIRHEEIQAGEFEWLLTDVEMGHDGFKNLRHYAPFDQTNWHFYQAGPGHMFEVVYDTVPNRLCARVTSVNGGNRQSKIRKRILLPDDFGYFPVDALVFKTRRASGGPLSFNAYLYNGMATDPSVNGVDVKPAVITPWYEMKLLTPTGFYFPGDFLTLELELNTVAVGHWCEIADIELAYKTARGNI